MLRGFPQARRLLRRMGLEKEDAYFWKQMGKGMLCTYALFGAAWLWNETSPLGWWTLKPRPKKQLQSKKFDQEAQKLWFRMRNEVVQELQEKGFDPKF
uniref:Uncharacterized protein n=1 Tax=Oryza rufipogon TaxID=4529 RepID=A0A0E0MW85_ORYRU